VKNLNVVYEGWPLFTVANKIIVDSKKERVECNPEANIVINSPFYVKWLRTLVDDKEYLKRYLWPLLEAFWKCPDVASFRSTYPQIVNESMGEMIQKRRNGTPYEFLDVVEGEGTSKLRALATQRPLTFNST
jgi:hypothetical protein